MSRLTKVASIHNNEPEFYEANIDLYPEMMGYEHQQAEMDCINKLGELEDLEEELGCPLEVVFKATTNGIIDFEGKEHTVVFGGYYLFVTENDELIGGISLKNYQKTWWLKGEKNE